MWNIGSTKLISQNLISSRANTKEPGVVVKACNPPAEAGGLYIPCQPGKKLPRSCLKNKIQKTNKQTNKKRAGCVAQVIECLQGSRFNPQYSKKKKKKKKSERERDMEF
jgi:hypothetical protein